MKEVPALVAALVVYMFERLLALVRFSLSPQSLPVIFPG